MHTKQSFSSNTNGVHQSSGYLERPRLHSLLEDAINHPLITVCAGAGYGKTRTVYSFLQKYESYTTWIQLSERDNAATRFWENCMYTIAQPRPEVWEKLRELGFPRSEAALAKFEEIFHQASCSLPKKHVMVFDDFHLLSSPEVLGLFEKTLSTLPATIRVILISRTMPKINMVGLMMQERVFIINEDTLRFTEDEISEYFNLLTLSATRQDIRNIYDDTRGWAFAVNLIGRSLHKSMKYKRSASETMKENIYSLIEREVSPIVSTPLWRFLLRISLVDNLAVGFLKTLDEAQFSEEILAREMERLNAFIHHEFQLGTYVIHHLFLEYLRKHQHALSEEEKRDTYQKAAVWCDANGHQMDAFLYYEKAGNYEAIVRKAVQMSLQVPDMSRYVLGILDRAPSDAADQSPLFHAMYLKLKISLGQFEEALALAERYVGEYEARPESPEKNRALSSIYAIWGILKMLDCTHTDVYDFDLYFEKMAAYYDKTPFALVGSYSNTFFSAWASLVGTSRAGAQTEYLQAVSRAIPYTSHVLNGSLYGLDDLVRGELCFYRQELDSAEQYLKQAADKASARDQAITHHQALFYLMQIALFRGDMECASGLLEKMEALLSEKDYEARYVSMHDIACGFFHLALNQAEQVAQWLKGDFSDSVHAVFLKNHANRVKALYHYHMRQYDSLLIFIDGQPDQQMILFGKIELCLLKALCLYHRKRRGEAIDALTAAYALAEPSEITTPFIQHSNDMRALTAAALKQEGCQIPAPWLENINRKASAHAKRRAQMLAANRLGNHADQAMLMSKREMAVLKELSKGLSRTEIAVSQNISVNTVKMVINHIYDKLGANSLADAIRIAAERGLL